MVPNHLRLSLLEYTVCNLHSGYMYIDSPEPRLLVSSYFRGYYNSYINTVAYWDSMGRVVTQTRGQAS